MSACEPIATYRPILEHDVTVLKTQLNRRNVEAGYALMGQTMDPEGKAAIDALSVVVDDKALRVDVALKAGWPMLPSICG